MILTKPYDRERAVTYAERWALDRNPLFVNFTGQGGDCTSFVSQALYAGSCTMDFTPDFGWYYVSADDRAPAWSSVRYFYDFITRQPYFALENDGTGPFGREVPIEEARVGDFIQLRNKEGVYYHSVIITGFLPDDVLVCAHSDDSLNRRLSTYPYAGFRIIHVEGVAVRVPDDDCFEPLLEGIRLGEGKPEDGETPPADPEEKRG